MENSRAMLRPADLVPLLGVSRNRIYQLLAKGALPAVREGRAIRIPRAAWETWLQWRSKEALGSVRGSGNALPSPRGH